MAKTLIDVDEQYLAAAQEALHTETKKDTVNAALREVAALAARRRICSGWPLAACLIWRTTR